MPETSVIQKEERAFYDANIAAALQNCINAGYKPLFMPQFVDALTAFSPGSIYWKNWFDTPSIIATGKTPRGNEVVVYGHIPNYLSDPYNLENGRKNLVRGAARLSPEEFQRFLSLEDSKDVFVIPYRDLRKSSSGVIPLQEALKHPQTIPFLGGRERKGVRFLSPRKNNPLRL